MNITQICATLASLIVNFVVLPFFITMYNRTKRNNILILIIGWIFILLGIFFKLLYLVHEETLFFTIDILFIYLGYCTLIIGINMYFITFKKNYIILINIVSSIIILTIHFLISYEEAIIFGRILTGIILITGLLLAYNYREKLKTNLGSKGFEWVLLTYFAGIFVILIFTIINEFWPEIASIGDMILAAYIIGVAINIINLEHRIAINERNILKDKFSHDITNYNQYFVMGVEIIQYEKDKLSANSKEILNNIQKQLTESNELLDKIRNL